MRKLLVAGIVLMLSVASMTAQDRKNIRQTPPDLTKRITLEPETAQTKENIQEEESTCNCTISPIKPPRCIEECVYRFLRESDPHALVKILGLDKTLVDSLKKGGHGREIQNLSEDALEGLKKRLQQITKKDLATLNGESSDQEKGNSPKPGAEELGSKTPGAR